MFRHPFSFPEMTLNRRLLIRVAYAVVLLVQVGVVAGAYEVHVLSGQKMMLMRFLVAKNLELETAWFSPASVQWQTMAFLDFLALCLLGLVLSVMRKRWVPAVHSLVGAVLAGAGVWLAGWQSTDELIALYPLLAGIWVALALQLLVMGVAFASKRGARLTQAAASEAASPEAEAL